MKVPVPPMTTPHSGRDFDHYSLQKAVEEARRTGDLAGKPIWWTRSFGIARAAITQNQ